MPTQYNENCATIRVVDNKGDATDKVIVETQKKSLETLEAEEIASAEKLGGAAEVTKRQTFSLASPTSWDEIVEMVPNEAARLAHYTRGIILYEQSARREFMLDENQQAVEGAYSLLTDVQEPRERRKADPNIKAANALSDVLGFKVTPELYASVLEQFKVAGTGGQVTV